MANGYKPRKSKVFEPDDMTKFLQEPILVKLVPKWHIEGPTQISMKVNKKTVCEKILLAYLSCKAKIFEPSSF